MILFSSEPELGVSVLRRLGERGESEKERDHGGEQRLTPRSLVLLGRWGLALSA